MGAFCNRRQSCGLFYENTSGHFILTRSYLHDFAAGLGEVVGRGTLTPADGGGYWIEGIDEAMPDNALSLRIGAVRVGHALQLGAKYLALSHLAPNQPARIILITQH
jgi:hypothetical protein